MSFKEFINFKLIESEHYSLSVYSLLLVSVIIAGTILLLKLIRKVFYRFETKKILDSGSSHSIFQIIKYLVYSLVIIFILEAVGIQFTAIVASVTAFAVVLALGVQQVFADWVGGILLLFEQKLKVGNIVQMEDGRVLKVVKINLRTSELLTREDIRLIVPNSKIANFKVVNWNLEESQTRFYVKVGVAYGSDMELVKEILLSVAQQHPQVLTSPHPFVRFKDFGDSALLMELFFWSTNNFRIENVKSDLRFSIDEIFRKKGVTIPFPQRDVHVRESKRVVSRKES